MIDDDLAARMQESWRPGCPVALEDLRYITLSHVDFAGEAVEGEIVVHADVAEDVVTAFRALFEMDYPIERMELVDEFGAIDDLSMAANNTSGFNCRFVAGTEKWSEHAYGRAIDLNPVVNPYVRGSNVSPPAGADYLDRTAAHPALIRAGDGVVTAFESIGWSWGGNWTSSRDYQHFSLTGR